MESRDEAWDSPEANTSTPSGLPVVMDLMSEVFKRVQEDFMQFFLAGLVPMGVTLVGTFLGIVVIYGAMFLGMMPGLSAGDDDLVGIGALLGASAGILVCVLALMAVITPMRASLYRAVWRYMTEDTPMTVWSSVDTFTQDLPRVYLLNTVFVLGNVIGLSMCYVGIFPWLLVMSFAGPAVYVHGAGVGDAVRLSISHATEHFSWHIGFFGLLFVMQMVLQYIPILGYALLMTVVPLYVLLAYAKIFGTGDTPEVAA